MFQSLFSWLFQTNIFLHMTQTNSLGFQQIDNFTRSLWIILDFCGISKCFMIREQKHEYFVRAEHKRHGLQISLFMFSLDIPEYMHEFQISWIGSRARWREPRALLKPVWHHVKHCSLLKFGFIRLTHCQNLIKCGLLKNEIDFF